MKRQGGGKTLILVWLDGLPRELLVYVLKPGKHASPEQATPDDLLKPGSGPAGSLSTVISCGLSLEVRLPQPLICFSTSQASSSKSD